MQLKRLVQSTVGVYGDLPAIVGHGLDALEGLELPMFEAASPCIQ